jgi:hypothetical protein
MKTTDDFFEAAKALTPLQKLNKSYGSDETKAKKDANTKAAYLKTKKELEQAMGKGGMDKHITSVAVLPKQHSFKLVGSDVNKIVKVLDLMIGLKQLAARNYQIKKYPSSNAVVLLHWSAIEAKLDRKWKNIWTAAPWQGR